MTVPSFTTSRGVTYQIGERVAYESGGGKLNVATVVGFGINSYGTRTLHLELVTHSGETVIDSALSTYVSKLGG